MRLFVASIRKLIRRPASFITLRAADRPAGVDLHRRRRDRQPPADGCGAAASLLLVTFPGAYTLIISFILGLGGLFAVIYGAAIAGSEWTWGTLKSAVARGESRTRYQLWSLFAAIAVMLGIGLLVAFVIGIVVAMLGAGLAGVSTEGLGDSTTLGQLPELLGRGWFAVVEEGDLGFAIATLARSQLAGDRRRDRRLLRRAVRLDLPARHRQVPAVPRGERRRGHAGGDGEFGGGGGAAATRLEPNAALLVVAAWLVGSPRRDRRCSRSEPRSPARQRLRDALERAADVVARADRPALRPTRRQRDDPITPRSRQTSLRAARLNGGKASSRMSGRSCSQSRVGGRPVRREGPHDRDQALGQREPGHHPVRAGGQLVDQEEAARGRRPGPDPGRSPGAPRSSPLVGGASALTPTTSGSARRDRRDLGGGHASPRSRAGSPG